MSEKTEQSEEKVEVEAEINENIKILLSIPKKIDLATLYGLISNIKKMLSVVSLDVPRMTQSTYSKKLYNTDNIKMQNKSILQYPFLKSKEEFMHFYNKFRATRGKDKQTLANQYNVTIDALRTRLNYYYKKFLMNGRIQKSLIENKQSDITIRKNHRWTEEEIQEIMKLKSENKTAKEIAKIISEKINREVSDASIYYLIKYVKYRTK